MSDKSLKDKLLLKAVFAEIKKEAGTPSCAVNCPHFEELVDYVYNEISIQERRVELEKHVDKCSRCWADMMEIKSDKLKWEENYKIDPVKAVEVMRGGQKSSTEPHPGRFIQDRILAKSIFKEKILSPLGNLFGQPSFPSPLPSHGSPLGGYLSTEAKKEEPVSFPKLKYNFIPVDIDLSAIAQAKGKLLPLPENAHQELQHLIKYAQKQKEYYYAGVLFDENGPLETIEDEPMKVDKVLGLEAIECLPKETTSAMIGFCPDKKLLYELVKKVAEGASIPKQEENRKVIWVLYGEFKNEEDRYE